MTDWQPIEMAPKGDDQCLRGPDILLWCARMNGAFVGWWEWDRDYINPANTTGEFTSYSSMDFEHHPVLWAPITPPPESQIKNP